MAQVLLNRQVIANIMHIGRRHQVTSCHQTEIFLDILYIATQCTAHLIEQIIKCPDLI